MNNSLLVGAVGRRWLRVAHFDAFAERFCVRRPSCKAKRLPVYLWYPAAASTQQEGMHHAKALPLEMHDTFGHG